MTPMMKLSLAALAALNFHVALAENSGSAVDPVVTPQGDPRITKSAPGEAVPGTSVKPESTTESSVPKTQMDRKAADTADVGATKMGDAKPSLADADREFYMKVHNTNLGEISAASMAQKSGSAKVKAYAAKLAADHRKADGELEVLAKKNGVKLDGAANTAPASTAPDMSAMKGAEFDRTYLTRMVSGHQEAITAFESESAQSKDSESKAFADRTLPHLKMHLADAQKLLAAMPAQGTAAK